VSSGAAGDCRECGRGNAGRSRASEGANSHGRNDQIYLRVVDDGKLVGIVDDNALFRVVVAEEDPPR